jgi:bifunctional non-homologous end joining protein LigD
MIRDLLKKYRAKRDFSKTAEPSGAARQAARKRGHLKFIIQKHDASRLHYDFRLEHDGVMLSWACPKGPSYNPDDKRLAVHVEDHPLEYNTFEGTIPQGEYGGGTVMLWDRGTWTPHGDVDEGLRKGKLSFDLDGKRLHGGWALVRLRGRPGETRDNWLLIKEKDEFATARGKPITETEVTSVASGRSMDEIAAGRRVWHSNRGKGGDSAETRTTARKRSVRKASTRKTTARKSSVRKTAARKTTARKSAPRKKAATARRRKARA